MEPQLMKAYAPTKFKDANGLSHAWCNALIMQRKEENDGLFYR